MQDRRSEARLLCADMLEVRWRAPAGRVRSEIGLLEDISRSGACLQLERAVTVGSEVRWESQGRQFQGVARYCEFREIGYFVGVEFAPGCEWSESSYHPAHLLDVEKLMP